MPKTRWKYDDGPIDLRTAAPRWTEAVETLTSQIDTLRTNSTIANGYTKFAMSVLRSKINNSLAPDVPSLSLEDAAEAARTGETGGGTGGVMGTVSDLLFGTTGPRGGQRDGIAQMVVKSAVRTAGSAIGREIVRGVLGSLLGGSRRKR